MRLLIVASLLIASPGFAGAQFPAAVQSGARVRVAWGGGIGALVGLTFPHEHWRRVIR